MDLDERQLMERAIELARPHHPHPNPRVGALVLAPDGTVVGSGAHAVRGESHAEVVALKEAGARANGAIAIVTLEPCDHTASTPPCTRALVEAGIARVVVGIEDPDKRVSGSGIATLREAGVEVVIGPYREEAEALDPGYFHHRRTGRPRVTLKLAATLDGQVAAADGTSQWITSEDARRDAHVLRSRSDAVVVGAGTVRADDPRLTVRLESYTGPQPRPVVIAGTSPLPLDAAILGYDPIVYAPVALDLPGEVVVVGDGKLVDLAAVIEDLGKREIVDLLIEGGPTIAGALQAADMVDRYIIYLAASIAGGLGRGGFEGVFRTIGDVYQVEIVRTDLVGGGLRIEALRRAD